MQVQCFTQTTQNVTCKFEEFLEVRSQFKIRFVLLDRIVALCQIVADTLEAIYINEQQQISLNKQDIMTIHLYLFGLPKQIGGKCLHGVKHARFSSTADICHFFH